MHIIMQFGLSSKTAFHNPLLDDRRGLGVASP